MDPTLWRAWRPQDQAVTQHEPFAAADRQKLVDWIAVDIDVALV